MNVVGLCEPTSLASTRRGETRLERSNERAIASAQAVKKRNMDTRKKTQSPRSARGGSGPATQWFVGEEDKASIRKLKKRVPSGRAGELNPRPYAEGEVYYPLTNIVHC